MIRLLRKVALGMAFVLSAGGATAAFVSFTEGALESDPVVVATNIVLTAPTLVTNESAIVTGFHNPESALRLS